MATATRPLSEAQMRARRRNACQSIGPRTAEGKRRAALNALRHGRYSRQPQPSLEALGEHPRAFDRLLVEGLAALRWQRCRCERAQLGKLVHRLEEVEFKDLRCTRQYEACVRQHAEISFAERRALLAPGQEEWWLLIRQQNALDRQIERKTRLLMQMQRERRGPEANRGRGWGRKKGSFLTKRS